MPVYQIYRLTEARRMNYRWAPHTSGTTPVKPREYEEDGLADASSPYAAWFQLKEGEKPLEVGDLLETLDGQLSICKYVGFEQAEWVLPEVTTGLETTPATVGIPSPPVN